MALPTFLPLEEAATRTGKPVEWLRELLTNGKIVAGQLPDGEKIIAVDAEGNVIETPAQPETRPEGVRELPVAVAGDDINAQLAAIRREDFKHLEGKAITVSEAVKKYGEKYGVGLVRRTITAWVDRGYVKELSAGGGRGKQKKLNEADVAYCASIHAVRKKAGISTGFKLLNDDGSPGLLKHPDLSKYRREQRQILSG